MKTQLRYEKSYLDEFDRLVIFYRSPVGTQTDTIHPLPGSYTPDNPDTDAYERGGGWVDAVYLTEEPGTEGRPVLVPGRGHVLSARLSDLREVPDCRQSDLIRLRAIDAAADEIRNKYGLCQRNELLNWFMDPSGTLTREVRGDGYGTFTVGTYKESLNPMDGILAEDPRTFTIEGEAHDFARSIDEGEDEEPEED